MMWTERSFGEVTQNFDSMRRPVKTTERALGPFPYYGASGVVDSVHEFIFDGEYLLVSEDGENLRTRSTPIAFMASGQFWVNNHAHVVRGSDIADTRFLCYALSMTDIAGYLTGSTQPKLTRSAMDGIHLRLPPLPQQQAIADVLGALDDKIAANSSLSAAAEGLALALVAGTSATVPLSEVVTYHKSPLDPSVSSAAVVAHFSLPAFDTGRIAEMASPLEIKSTKFAVEQPSVLVSKLNPRFPRVWDIPELPSMPALASTEFLVLVPQFSSSTFLWALLLQPSFGSALESKVSGTSGSHQRVRPDDLLATLVPDPRAFDDVVKDRVTSLGLRAIQARRESTQLAATRDALLPALMSGALRVRDAERLVEDAV